jgi:hypothetical protein
MTVPDHNDFTMSGAGNDDDLPFSFACWIDIDGIYGDYEKGIICKGHGWGSNGFEWRIYASQLNAATVIYVDISDGASFWGDGYRRTVFHHGYGASAGWHHFVVTYEGGPIAGQTNHGVKLYLNGVSQTVQTMGGTDVEGMSNLGGDLYLGRIDNAMFPFEGDLMQMIVWKNYELSSGEATYLYAAGADHRDPTVQCGTDYQGHNNVVGWWSLNNVYTDASGNGHNATNQGTTGFTSSVPF